MPAALKRDTIAHLGTLDFVAAKDNVVFLGPPGTGKTHLAIGIAIRACQAGHRVLFATASEWVARLAEADHAGRLQQELIRLGRYPLLVVDLFRSRHRSTNSDTSKSTLAEQNYCSRSSPNVKNAPRSRSRPTCPSASGAPSSPTLAWSLPSSTASPSTPTS